MEGADRKLRRFPPALSGCPSKALWGRPRDDEEDRFMLAPHARPGNNPPAPSAGTAANCTASVAPSRRAASEAECRQHRRRVSRDGCRDFHLIDGKPGILQPVAGEDTDHSGAFRHSELQQTGHRRSRSGLAED